MLTSWAIETFSKYLKELTLYKTCFLEFPCKRAGYGSVIVTAVARVAAVAQVRSLAWELLHDARMAKKTKTNKKNHQKTCSLTTMDKNQKSEKITGKYPSTWKHKNTHK